MSAPDRLATGRSAFAGSLSTAFEMAELGAQIRERRFRREHPAASDDDVAAFMRAWWSERPGAPFGDSAGRPVTR